MVLPLWLKIVATVVAVAVLVTGKFYFKLKNDNPIEKIAEEVIEEETGVSIDLNDVSVSDSSVPVPAVPPVQKL